MSGGGVEGTSGGSCCCWGSATGDGVSAGEFTAGGVGVSVSCEVNNKNLINL